jgi:hypothetical protein
LVVAVDSNVGVYAAELTRSWNDDGKASACGTAETQARGAETFLPPELLEWVAVPMAVNLASSVVYDLVRRLVTTLRGDCDEPQRVEELDIFEHQSGSDRVVIVRLRRPMP